MISSTAFTLVAALAAAITPAFAHMEMINPPPWNSKSNPNTPHDDIDYSMTSPLDASGANYPCKGYHSVLGTAAGKSVATWAPGSTQTVSIGGTAVHGGGSCQLLLSFDGGHSFKVIQSVLGDCPITSTWDFTLPTDIPSGDAVFAWTWFNRLGNREMYMNCASVTIGGGQQRRDGEVYTNSTRRGVDFNSAPNLFAANIGNGCGTEEGGDVDFPNPGSAVVRRGGFSPRAPIGNCAGGGGSSGPSKPEPSSEPVPSPSASSPSGSAPSSTTDGEWSQPRPTDNGEWNKPSATNDGEWNKPSATNDGEWNKPAPSSADDGMWRPSSSAAPPSPSISAPDWGNWHNNGSSSAEPSAEPSAAPAPSPSSGKKTCKRVRRHKRRMNHGKRGHF